MPDDLKFTLHQMDEAIAPFSGAKVIAQAQIDICDGLPDHVDVRPLMKAFGNTILKLGR